MRSTPHNEEGLGGIFSMSRPALSQTPLTLVDHLNNKPEGGNDRLYTDYCSCVVTMGGCHLSSALFKFSWV